MKRRMQQHTTFPAWLLVLGCLSVSTVLAQTAPTNGQPPVANSVAEPDSEPNTWADRATEALRAGKPDVAMPWIQRLLQADPAALASTNGVTFRPARRVAMELIRAIPERALKEYRMQMEIAKGTSDPAPKPTDPAALEARYQDVFASDRMETGFCLAGFYLDQGRYVDGPTNLPPQLSIRRAYAVARMLEDHRRPADDIVFAGNRAWINGLDDLALIDLASGHVIRRTQHIPDPPQDAGAGKSFTMVMAKWNVEEFRGARGGAVGPAETWIFDSRLSRAASFNESRVYCVEDDIRASEDRRQSYMRPQPSGNALAAYDAATGKLLWRVGRELPLEPKPKKGNGWQANAIRFAAAPVPCAGLLLAPVEEDNGLSVVGLEAETGERVWRTRIVWRKPLAEPRSATMTLTVDGADVYLCGDNSWVSRMDGCDGSVRWTTLYEPLETTVSTNAADKETKLRNAWEEGLVLVAGDAVVALPEVSQEIMVLDRQNGTPLGRRSKPEGVNYVLGRQGSSLIVAGERAAACVDLADGRTRWRWPALGWRAGSWRISTR